MSIRRITPTKQIMQYMQDGLSAYEQTIIRRLAHAGEQLITHARTLPSPPREMRGTPHQPNYIDWSENLRNSTGYIVTINGNIVVGGQFDESFEGGREGRKFAESLASKFPRGIVLIVVAGMNYAAYVEAKGYDVLTSSEILANRIVPKMLQKLGSDKK